jgi:uncharacterized membrane protein
MDKYNEYIASPFGKYWTDFIFMIILSIAIVLLVIYCFKKYKISFPKFQPFAILVFAYWLIAMLFGQFYSAINYFNNSAFDNVQKDFCNWDFTYYSFSIITCLGPTDITPVSYLAKFTSLIEAGISLFFLSVLISLLLNKNDN